jgi:CO dehydrogenase maturation factor
MTLKIAVSGKGGTGKTTLSGLLIAALLKDGKRPILAIDADANSTLHETLGVEPEVSIGQIREHTRKNIDAIPPGVPKETFLEMKVQEAVTEGDGFDLLVMGRPEGSGCYCYVNSVLRKYVDVLAGNYPYVVMDNEAGMEHLSRRTSQGADALLICSDPTVRGIMTAERIAELAREEDMNVGRIFLVIGRQPESAGIELQDRVKEKIKETGLELIGIVPYDEGIEKIDLAGGAFRDLPDDSPALMAAREILIKIENK